MIPGSELVPLRRFVYGILITLAVGTVAGKILAVQRVYEPALFRADPKSPSDSRSAWPKDRPEPEPTLGDNDRSRWATVRALVDDGTYAIGYRDENTKGYQDGGIIAEDGWKTIDKVLRPAPAGERRMFYSSKPPFLATLVAGEYWVLKHVFGLSIISDRWVVVRVILLTFNLLPLVVYLVLLARLVERYGTSDWGRLMVLAAAGLATFVLAFSITLNNHVLAAYAVVMALYPTLMLWSAYRADPRQPLAAGYFVLAGLFAALAACFELPALSFAVALLILLLWVSPRRTLAFFVPAAAVPAAALFLTNYLAIGQFAPAYSEFGGPWYQYAGSHWLPTIQGGIDYAHEPKAVYAMHLLIGHHGFFSLTPIFLPALLGMCTLLFLRRPRIADGPAAPGFPVRDSGLLGTMLLTLLLSVVVFGFYIYKTNNYGGWTSGPRWLIWLTPLWLLSLLPAADWLSTRRWGRVLVYVLLAVSVVSANYPPWNPWRHPWFYNLLETIRLVHY